MPKIYVGNLSFEVDENLLRDSFAAHGRVEEVNIITDRETGRSRGFAFVEMPDSEECKKAIEEMNLFRLEGRSITVNEARPRENRGGGGRRY